MLLNAVRYAVASNFLGVQVPIYILYFAGIAVAVSWALGVTKGLGTSMVFLAASAAVLMMAGVLTGVDIALVSGIAAAMFAVRMVLKAAGG